MVEFNVDLYEITIKYIVPGMLLLAVIGVLLFQMGDNDIFGSVGSVVFGSGLSMP